MTTVKGRNKGAKEARLKSFYYTSGKLTESEHLYEQLSTQQVDVTHDKLVMIQFICLCCAKTQAEQFQLNNKQFIA